MFINVFHVLIKVLKYINLFKKNVIIITIIKVKFVFLRKVNLYFKKRFLLMDSLED